MPAFLTPEFIASAITGLMFALAGIGVYSRTKTPKLEGAFKVESENTAVSHQLERIAQALEDLVAAEQNSFQNDMRQRFEKLEEIMEHQAEERRRRERQTQRN